MLLLELSLHQYYSRLPLITNCFDEENVSETRQTTSLNENNHFFFLIHLKFIRKKEREKEEAVVVISLDVSVMSSDSVARHRLINQTDFSICC